MCKVYNTIGSLTALKSSLARNNIHDFKSLREVMDFQSSYSTLRKELISYHENLIQHERTKLGASLQELNKVILQQKQETEQRLLERINKLKLQLTALSDNGSGSFFRRLVNKSRQWNFQRKLKHTEKCFEGEIESSVRYLIEDYQVKDSRMRFISSNSEEAVMQSARYFLSELDRKKTVIDGLNSFIYGALGEQKVAKVLESLSDDYHLINDFAVSFSPAIYNRQENDYIKSVQIDHILIGPPGVFLIETKNWSEKSLTNLSLRSPVQQIKRASFALFKLLNIEVSNYHLHLNRHHWGDKRISIKNLIVLISTKPKEEFQYVKVLTLGELMSYITYLPAMLSNLETQNIAEFLLGINSTKDVEMHQSGYYEHRVSNRFY